MSSKLYIELQELYHVDINIDNTSSSSINSSTSCSNHNEQRVKLLEYYLYQLTMQKQLLLHVIVNSNICSSNNANGINDGTSSSNNSNGTISNSNVMATTAFNSNYTNEVAI
jgi:hypothetical protein